MITMSSPRLTNDEVAAAQGVLRSGHLRAGQTVAAFEAAFAETVGARHAIALASGTAALHLSALCLLSPGDEVLVPALSFPASATMVLARGATPVFCDIDPNTWLIDLEDASRRVTDRCRAILPVHLFGLPHDRPQVESFARSHGLTIIWDAAQAHGACQGGTDVGSWGPATCYSFYATKNLFVGEGGMVCTDDRALAQRIRARSSHGMDAEGEVVELGFNYRMGESQAAIGLSQLGRFPTMAARRRHNAERLRAGLSGLPGVTFQAAPPDTEPAWHHFCVRIIPRDFGRSRDALAAALLEHGIASAVYYRKGIHRHPLFHTPTVSLPETEALTEQILALPVHHDLSDDDLATIVASIWTIAESAP
jgi:perosamine synthetase